MTWDARGSGESTHEGPYDLETDSSDLEAVLEHVGAAAVVIAVANGSTPPPTSPRGEET